MNRQKLSELKKAISLFLKHLGVEKIHLPQKPFRDLVAENLYSIFLGKVTIMSLIILFGIAVISSSSSSEQLMLVTKQTFYALATVYLPFAFFEIFYVGTKIVSKLEQLNPLAQYNVLQIGRKPFLIMFFGLIFTIVSLSLSMFRNVLGLQEFIGNEFIHKTLGSMTLVGMGTIIITMPAMIIFPLQTVKEMRVSLNVIQDFDEIAENVKVPIELADVWKRLTRNILYGSEALIKEYIGISSVELSTPFNIVSLAAIIGHEEQRERAKQWMQQLNAIVLDDEVKKEEKADMILSHMERVRQDFPKSLELYEQYKLDYKLELRGWKKSVRALGTLGKIAVQVATIGGFILTIILLLR